MLLVYHPSLIALEAILWHHVLSMNYQVLLYYIYAQIDDPQALVERQKALCQELGLTGRIIIAQEGLNGTVEGTAEHIRAYQEASASEPAFATVHYKVSEGTGSAFKKLSVRAREEIVSAHLGERDVNPAVTTGKYLEAEELHEWIRSGKEFYIVDMRNDYEHAVGHFAGSILPAMRHFRELPDILSELDHLRGKTVVTVCTGGVRCEKASGFLLENGYADVWQLKDGIVTYMEKYPGEDFHGALYVFDGRVTMAFNAPEERTVVGRCEKCGVPCEDFVNCMEDQGCHRHFICCTECAAKEDPIFCSEKCRKVGVLVRVAA
jgi:UPF0176 protein